MLRYPTQPALFFVLALAFSIGWTAISSELARYAAQYGNDVLLKLSLAFYLPSVPLLLTAVVLDEAVDRRVGRHVARTFRAIAGFGGCAAILAALPLPAIQASLPRLLAAVAALGVASSVAFGCSYQLAGRCEPSATVALTLGFVSSAPLVLVLEAALRLGPCCSAQQAAALYEAAAVVAGAGLAAALAVARQQRSYSRQRLRLGASVALSLPRLQQPLLETGQAAADPEAAAPAGGLANHPDGNGEEAATARTAEPALGSQAGGSSEWAPLLRTGAGEAAIDVGMSALSAAASPLARQLSGTSDDLLSNAAPDGSASSAPATLAAVWPAAAALSLGVGASMFLFPFLTQLPPRQLGAMLPVVLFWTRCFADIAGRLLPRLCGGLGPPGRHALLALALLRVATLPLPLLYIAGRLPAFCYSDWLLVAYVAAMWLSSGALNVYAYLLVPRLVPPALTRRATSVMTLSFNAACLAGLLAAVPFSSP
ncbi:hypothetical protein ABPG75_007915 [Micractinium tetrahymenae]